MRSTTGQRTHQYLRLALVALVVALFVGVFAQIAVDGEILPSISHYFYTPARNVFVGCLIAASLALIALSGRNSETVLLDVAAVFAPLIALVPTKYDDEIFTPVRECPAGAACLPAEYLPEVRNGVIVYAVMVALISLTALVVRVWTRRPVRGTLIAGGIGIATAAALLVLAFVPGVNESFPFNTALPISIHFAATIAFFGTFAAVPIVHAFGLPARTGEHAPNRWQRVVYVTIPVLLVIALVLTVVLMGPWPGVLFWGEFVALALFAVFWVVQTIQRWDAGDPQSII